MICAAEQDVKVYVRAFVSKHDFLKMFHVQKETHYLDLPAMTDSNLHTVQPPINPTTSLTFLFRESCLNGGLFKCM